MSCPIVVVISQPLPTQVWPVISGEPFQIQGCGTGRLHGLLQEQEYRLCGGCCGWSYPPKAGSQAADNYAVLSQYVCFLDANNASHAVDVIFDRPHGQEAALPDDQFPLAGMILHMRMNMQFYPSADGCLRLQVAATLSCHRFSSRSASRTPHSAPRQCPRHLVLPASAGGRRGARPRVRRRTRKEYRRQRVPEHGRTGRRTR